MEPDETNVTPCGGLFYHRKADGGGVDKLSLRDVRGNIGVYRPRCERHEKEMEELKSETEKLRASGGDATKNEDKMVKLKKTIDNNNYNMKYWQDAEAVMVERQKS